MLLTVVLQNIQLNSQSFIPLVTRSPALCSFRISLLVAPRDSQGPFCFLCFHLVVLSMLMLTPLVPPGWLQHFSACSAHRIQRQNSVSFCFSMRERNFSWMHPNRFPLRSSWLRCGYLHWQQEWNSHSCLGPVKNRQSSREWSLEFS